MAIVRIHIHIQYSQHHLVMGSRTYCTGTSDNDWQRNFHAQRLLTWREKIVLLFAVGPHGPVRILA